MQDIPELLKAQCIGKSLVHEGLALLKTVGAKGCVLVGDPAHYERFGFRSPKDLVVVGVPQKNLLTLPFEENKASGTAVFHDGFAAKG